MANGLLDYLSGFGATAPEYMGSLLGEDAVDKLRGRAATTGIANAVLGYLAAPKNQNLGLGRIIGQSLQAGMQGAQGVYDTALTDWQTQQKIAEMQRQQKQQAAQDLFRTRIGQPNATRDVVTQDTMQVPVAQGTEAPSFQTQMPVPTVTKQQYFDPKVMMNEALQSGALPFDKYLEYSIKEAKPRETTIAPNGQLIYKDTGELVTSTSFAAPKEAPSMTEEPNRVAFALYGKPLNQLNPQQVGNVNTYIEQGKVRVAGAGVPSSQPTFTNATELRKEFRADPTVKAFNEVNTAYNQIKGSLSNPSPANDLAAATKFMKLLDPNSVVRESELIMAMNATGLFDRVQNYANYVISGKKLNATQREDFANASAKLFEAALQSKNAIENQYIDIAKTGGLDPKLIVGSPTSQDSIQSRAQAEIARRKKDGK
jgi:hypothetical protein